MALGVDGGTSKTRALIATLDGTVVGHAETGGSNVYEGDSQAGLANAMAAPRNALIAAEFGADMIDCAVFSMSGADWPEDMVMFRAAARAEGFGASVLVVNDAIGGLRAGNPGPDAVAIICGTHAACAARNASGAIWHNSFWQMVGGAHDLGSAALKAMYTADLGITPETSLTEALLQRYDANSPADLLHRHTALVHDTPPSPALLAELVLDHADAGDWVANDIVTRQGVELARFALAAARKVDIATRPFDLVLGGSVFRHRSTVLVDAIVHEMRGSSPDLRTIHRHHEPIVGALMLALEANGIVVDDAIESRIAATLPPGWY